MASFLHFQIVSFSTFTDIVSTSVAMIAFFMVVLIYPFFILRTLNKEPERLTNDEKYRTKYATLITQFDSTKFWKRNMMVILLFRRTILVAALVFLHDYPTLQIIATTTTTCMLVIY